MIFKDHFLLKCYIFKEIPVKDLIDISRIAITKTTKMIRNQFSIYL